MLQFLLTSRLFIFLSRLYAFCIICSKVWTKICPHPFSLFLPHSAIQIFSLLIKRASLLLDVIIPVIAAWSIILTCTNSWDNFLGDKFFVKITDYSKNCNQLAQKDHYKSPFRQTFNFDNLLL